MSFFFYLTPSALIPGRNISDDGRNALFNPSHFEDDPDYFSKKQLNEPTNAFLEYSILSYAAQAHYSKYYWYNVHWKKMHATIYSYMISSVFGGTSVWWSYFDVLQAQFILWCLPSRPSARQMPTIFPRRMTILTTARGSLGKQKRPGRRRRRLQKGRSSRWKMKNIPKN